MREIKFRAWDKENDRMLFPDDTDDILFEITIDGIKTIDLNGNEDPYVGLPYLNTVVMQYTGLKDKNGVEIYEGDIIVWKYSEKPQEVFWDSSIGGFSTKHYHLWRAVKKVEVIGNVYENPELLEELK